jgi:hypothetical protein
MDSRPLELSEAARAGCADRIGMARLAKMAFDGKDLRPIWAELIAKLLDGRAEAGEGLDLSLIAQLLGDKEAGLAIQHEVLLSHQLFRSPCVSRNPRLRVLALAAATDMGSNTPIEFLLEESGVELMMLYVIGEAELPVPLPDHDVAIVIASDSEDCREALRKIDAAVSRWPRPLLNPPKRVCNLDRDKLHRLLGGVAGLRIPATIAVMREQPSRPNLPFPSSCGRADRTPVSASPRSTTARRWRAISKGAKNASSSSRDLSTTPARTACSGNAGSYSSTEGPTPATWRSPTAGTSGISTPK